MLCLYVLQGLAGGLALLCLFMTYIQYATAGRDGFLAFYSPQAEVRWRAAKLANYCSLFHDSSLGLD